MKRAAPSCHQHPTKPAIGLCAVCKTPCCAECGRRLYGAVLCPRHAEYESYEGNVKVFGSMDVVQSEYVKARLEEAGLHPFVYSRVQRPNPNTAGFITFPQVYERTITEQKVLVPFEELEAAEKTLKELEIL